MTAPRKVVPGENLHIVRRVTQRKFLTPPDPLTREIFAYCLAEAAKRFDIDIIHGQLMSNHYHLIIHDRQGHYPKFIEHLNKMLAKVLNARWGRRENFWSTEETCVVRLVSLQDVFDAVVYGFVNPLNAHLVDRVAHWPGFSTLEHLRGKVTTHRRPKYYFGKKSTMPETATLRTVQPPESARIETADQWAERVLAEIAKIEEELIKARQQANVRVLGRKAVLATSPDDSPSTTAAKRELRPRLACRNQEMRNALLHLLREFWHAYREARERFASGDLGVEFPAGTYRMRLLGARCEPFPIAA